MPVWPATNTRLPCRSKGRVERALVGVGEDTRLLDGKLVKIGGHHFGDQLLKRNLVLPSELAARLGRIAKQDVDLGRAEISRINAD